MEDYFGQSYNYSKHIKGPSEVGVSNRSDLGALIDNVGGLSYYMDSMTFGTNELSSVFGHKGMKPLGTNFFVKSGTCSKSASVSDCKGKQRYIYVKNIPTGKIPCLGQAGIKLPATGFRGLVPGLLEDIAQINPIEIFNSVMGSGSTINDKCILRREKVGTYNSNKYETHCSPEPQEIKCLPELFQDYKPKKKKYVNQIKLLSIISLCVIIWIILFYNY